MLMVSVFALRFLSVSLLILEIRIIKKTLRKRSAKTLTLDLCQPIWQIFFAADYTGCVLVISKC